MSKTLLVVSIGPVQSFIAAGRKTEDLWSGSYMLSYFAEKAMQSLLEHAGTEIVYPAVTRESLTKREDEGNADIASLPNRFVALLAAEPEQARSIAQQIKAAVYRELEQLVWFAIQRVFPPDNVDLHPVFLQAQQQVADMLEFFWAVEPLENEDAFEVARKNLEKRLAAVKNNRPVPVHRQTGLICELCGERDALHDGSLAETDTIGVLKKKMKAFWAQRHRDFQTYGEQDERKGRINDGEFLCGICLGKRVAREYFRQPYQSRDLFSSFASTLDIAGEDSYYAVLLMDGDDMGKWFAGEKRLANLPSERPIDQYREISKRLASFAKEAVPKIVNDDHKRKGRLVYAGGDDVLAFAPVDRVLELAQKLYDAFRDPHAGLGPEATASMGIVIAHAKDPLYAVLQQVRDAEKAAKNYLSPHNSAVRKNAFTLAYLARSGEIRKVVLPWSLNEEGIRPMELLQTVLEKVNIRISSTFFYSFGQSLLPLLGSEIGRKGKAKFQPILFADQPDSQQLPTEALQSELKRLLTRAAKNKEAEKDIPQLVEALTALHRALPSTFQFIQLLQIIRNLGGDSLGSDYPESR